MRKIIGLCVLTTGLISCDNAPPHTPPQATAKQIAKITPPKTLSILDYNVGLFDLNLLGVQMLEPADYVPQRLQALPQALLDSDADIIALQEIYLSDHQKFVIDKLKHSYPYILYQPTTSARQQKGLMILSKYPLTNSKYHRSKNAGPLDERFVMEAGFLETNIELGNGKQISFINIHPTAGGFLSAQDSQSNLSVRGSQIDQAMKLVKDKSAIVVGDFNAGPEIAPSNYHIGTKYGYIDSYLMWAVQNDLPTKITWDSKNSLNSSSTHSDSISQRIDHIFLSKSLHKQVKIINSKRVFDVPTVEVHEEGKQKKVTLSDHYGLQTVIQLL